MKAASLPNLNRETTSFPNFLTLYQDVDHDDDITLNEGPNIDHGDNTEASETSPFNEFLSLSPLVSSNEIGFLAVPRSVMMFRRESTLPTSSVGSNQFSSDSGACSEGTSAAQLWRDRYDHPDFPEDEFRRAFNTKGGVAEEEEENGNNDVAGRAMKRPRLVWTLQLHNRFVDAVAHLGIKNAVPKTIMQLMGIDGLTRENVASHLQKYRNYLKRMQGLSNEGPSELDLLFASTPVPQSLHESGGVGTETRRRDTGTWSGGSGQGHGNGQVQMPIPMPYPPQMMHMPVLGMSHSNGPMGMPMGNPATPGPYHGFESHPYSMVQQRDWSGNKSGSFASYQHVTPNDK